MYLARQPEFFADFADENISQLFRTYRVQFQSILKVTYRYGEDVECQRWSGLDVSNYACLPVQGSPIDRHEKNLGNQSYLSIVLNTLQSS